MLLHGFCFDTKLRKCSEELFFFGHDEGKLETFVKICVAASLETLHEDPTIRALQNSATNRLFGNYSAKSVHVEPPLPIMLFLSCRMPEKSTRKTGFKVCGRLLRPVFNWEKAHL